MCHLQSELLLPVLFNDKPSLNVFKVSNLSLFPRRISAGRVGRFYCLVGVFFFLVAWDLLFRAGRTVALCFGARKFFSYKALTNVLQNNCFCFFVV